MILVLGWSASSAAAEAPTQLDLAVEAGMSDPEARDAFYELYDASSVFIVISDAVPAQQLDDLVGLPLIASDLGGLPLINVFDTEDRLEAFVASRGVQNWRALQVRGGATLSLMDSDYYLLLNPETEHQKFFYPEEIRQLRGEPIERALRRDQLTGLAEAAPHSTPFAEALQAALVNQPQITAAYLLAHPAPPATDRPAYLMALVVEREPDAAGPIIEEIGGALSANLEDELYLVDFMMVTEDQLGTVAAPDAQAFFAR